MDHKVYNECTKDVQIAAKKIKGKNTEVEDPNALILKIAAKLFPGQVIKFKD